MGLEYFSDNKYKYSTALMFAYIKLYKPKKNKLNLDDLQHNLKFNCWANNIRPIDVLNNFTNKKYKNEILRIKNADIKYPIIIDTHNNILDGVHRYVKHIMENKKKITAYIFNKKIMKLFIIGKRDEILNLNQNDLITLFYQCFKSLNL